MPGRSENITFRMNIPSPSSGWSKPSKNEQEAGRLLLTHLFLGLFLDPENGSDMFFRNCGLLRTTWR
jgi:hypothetical protein